MADKTPGPTPEPLTMYGERSNSTPLDWAHVEERLTAAGLYWVVANGTPHPHPRPVWGVWVDARVYLSLGSPVLRRALAADPRVTVHLDGATDVVIVEGAVTGERGDADVVRRYDAKYDFTYDAAQYGPFLEVTPEKVMAWRVAGPAGRDGFTETGRWRFPALSP